MQLLFKFLWSKTLSAPSFGRYGKQLIGRPYWIGLNFFFINSIRYKARKVSHTVHWSLNFDNVALIFWKNNVYFTKIDFINIKFLSLPIQPIESILFIICEMNICRRDQAESRVQVYLLKRAYDRNFPRDQLFAT